MTPAGYDFRSSPRTGSRGGGVDFVTRTAMSACVSFRPLDYRSFDAVEMRLSLISVACVRLYRPSPSKRTSLANSMFLIWMNSNKLKLNADKTEVTLVGSASRVGLLRVSAQTSVETMLIPNVS